MAKQHTAEVRRVRKEYTVIVKCDESYGPRLKIGHQTFVIGKNDMPKVEAEWYRDQLAIALARLIDEEKGK